VVEVLEAMAELKTKKKAEKLLPGVSPLGCDVGFRQAKCAHREIQACRVLRAAAEKASGNMMYVIFWHYNKDEPMFNAVPFVGSLVDREMLRSDEAFSSVGYACFPHSKYHDLIHWSHI
jgi:hypothetical protein